MKKKYWQSFVELNQSETFRKSSEKEFHEELPFELADGKGFLQAKATRRDFLKYLGFSTAAATLAASCKEPVKKIIPFVNKPENIIPGVADYYATTYVQDGEAVSILAKVRDGRPIKIEGNDLSLITNGGTSARVQASVLDLYDTARLRFPTVNGNEASFDAIDKEITKALSGKRIVLLTSTVNSPSSLKIIQQFLSKYPNSKHVVYDAVSYSGMLLANKASYGKAVIPSYRFNKAKIIVSIDADFLGTWLSPVEFAKQYAKGRKINEQKPAMNKHFQFESVPSLTGSNADEKYLHRPSETGMIALNLLNAINGKTVTGNEKLKSSIEKIAEELIAHKGEALVVCGSNDVNVQIIVNAINEALNANGKTIDWSSTYNFYQGIDADFTALVNDMNAGKVDALIVYGANPAYTWCSREDFITALKKVTTTVSLNPKADETTQLCKYVIPTHHFLESWGDAEPKTGFYSFLQPTIHPLFKTRQWQDSLLKWTDAKEDYASFLKSYWIKKSGSETGWFKILQQGVMETKKIPASSSYNSKALSATIAAIHSFKKSENIELQLYQKVAIGAGQQASNPWLQELPDPVTRATWDNYVIVSPALAKSLLKIDLNDNSQADAYEVHPAKKMVRVTVNEKSVTLPALIIPGTNENTIGIALGYGRTGKTGKAVIGTGKNVFPFTNLNNGTINYSAADVKIELTNDVYEVALTQTHNTYNTPQGNRTEVIKELSLSEFKENPKTIINEREKELASFGGIKNFKEQGTIYPSSAKQGIHWGMSVDLNSCIGCGACVVACNAENNVPVVGKPEVMRFHEMHWLRIDRYYSGDTNNPETVFQPMLCQQCDDAPCENVCPVAATNHSSEGLNQMVYNRCIGTRYCANNCPYKVRRFNWADYTGADSFQNNQKGIVNDTVLDMNNDLSRMVLNPDVTVRSRGVMEKCSFCVQRLQEGKLKAKNANRPLEDDDVKTACQQACPTNAIVFGNINDEQSEITKARSENQLRTFYSLEQLHVMPNVNYLAKVRNTDV